MKNKHKFTIIFFIIYLLLPSYSKSNDSFNFDVTEIEIRENGNKFIGKNKGTATSIDGTQISANNFEYNKVKNILISYGKVKIFDPTNKVTIYSEKITYFKDDELIITDGNSKAIDDQVEIDAKNFEYNKLKNIIYAKGNVKIDNKKESYIIYSDNVTYNKNIGKIDTKKNSKAISDKICIKSDKFTYYQNHNILVAIGRVKIEDKIENYVLETQYANYDRNLQKIFTKGKTKALLEKDYEFNSTDVFLDRNLKELRSDYISTIKDDNSNFYKLSKFLYFYEKKLLRGSDIEVETNYKKEKNDKFYFKNAFINFSDNFLSKDTKINIHKKVFDKERNLDDDQKDIFEGENDPRIYGASSYGNEDIIVLNKAIFTSCKNDNSFSVEYKSR